MAYDTLGNSLDFYIINEKNKPYKNINVIVQIEDIDFNGKLKYDYINLISDSDGFCNTPLFFSNLPLKIQALKNEILVYEFYFDKELNDYGYTINIKICEEK